MPNGEK
jgi:dual specificity tyrosine-phosphorylation-regulated kinase 2/3/4